MTRAQIVERARRHVGHRELRPNDSPLIDEWVARCGLSTTADYPWCAAWASWVLDLEPGIAGAMNLLRHFPETDFPQPGDLMGFPVGGKGSGHVGIVVSVSRTEALCIEGNSDNRVRYVRRLREQVRFARVSDEKLPAELLLREADAELWRDAPLVFVRFEGTR